LFVTKPVFKNSIIHLNEKQVTINSTDKNRLSIPVVEFDSLLKSNTFNMALQPKAQGYDVLHFESPNSYPFLKIPLIQAKNKVFTDSQKVTIIIPPYQSVVVNVGNKRTLRAENKNMLKDSLFVFTINESCTINCQTFKTDYQLWQQVEMKYCSAQFIKVDKNLHLKLFSQYNNLYTAGGDNALIDLERGSANWRIGGWQGYAGKDMIAVVDVGSEKKLKLIGLGCLQDQGAWVMMPKEIIFEGSRDGKTFEPIQTVQTNVSDTIDHAIAQDFVVHFYKPTGQVISDEVQTQAIAKPYRYYRVTAKNYGKLPDWHWSKGEPAWLFLDEILIEE
jgi:hypothetical protein